jgi:hypothetical protein
LRGNLTNGANDGVFYVNANNALTNANWNYLPTLSVYFELICSVSRAQSLIAQSVCSKCVVKSRWLVSCC